MSHASHGFNPSKVRVGGKPQDSAGQVEANYPKRWAILYRWRERIKIKDKAISRDTQRTFPTAPAQVHSFLLKLRRKTSSRLAHQAPPFPDYARKVSTKSGEDHFGWNEVELSTK